MLNKRIRKRLFKLGLSASILLFTSVPVAPQSSEDAPASGPEIIVEGSRPLDRDTVIYQIRNAYPLSIMREPVMRYLDPVCVQVNGLGPSGNAQVLKYMRETIRSLSIPLAQVGCRGNAVVVVSTNPLEQLRRIHERTPRVLSAEQLELRSQEYDAGAHAVVWHNRTVRGADGERLPLSVGMAGITGGGDFNAPINNNGRASRRKAGYSVAADVGVVAYDATKLDGVELKQLAHHAAMRLLAPGFAIDVQPDSPQTILSGIEQGRGPPSLTRFDRALLSTLYGMTPNEFGTSLARAAGNAYMREE